MRVRGAIGNRRGRRVGEMGSAICGANPQLEDRQVDREADPHGDAEELVWLKMGKRAGGEEDSHDGAGGSDSKEDGNGA